MSLNFLRIMLLVQILAAGIAVFSGHGYLEWQRVPIQEITSSRDAAYAIKNLLSDWWFFKGVCGGVALCMASMATVCRQEILNAQWYIKVHWMAQAFPISAVLVYGHNI